MKVGRAHIFYWEFLEKKKKKNLCICVLKKEHFVSIFMIKLIKMKIKNPTIIHDSLKNFSLS